MKFNYGYWCQKDGTSYWGIQFPNTIAIGKMVHHLPKECKARLLGWKFA